MRPSAAAAAPIASGRPWPIAGADGIDVLARAVDREDTVAPGAGALGDVAGPDRVLRHDRAQLLHEGGVRAELREIVRERLATERAEFVLMTGRDVDLAGNAFDDAFERQLGVGADEEVVRIVAAVGERIGVDLDHVLRQLHCEVAVLVRPQARAHDQREVDR